MENTYSIKNLKTFMGMDTPGFNCSLYCNGRRVATAIEDGSGGEMSIEYTAPSDQVAHEEFCKTLPPWLAYDNTYLPTDPAIHINNLVNDYENDRRLRRLCKTKIIVIKKDQEPGTMTEYAVLPTEANFARLRNHLGANLVEIINLRYL